MSYSRSVGMDHSTDNGPKPSANEMSPEISRQRLAQIQARLDQVSASSKLAKSPVSSRKPEADVHSSSVRLFPNGTEDLSLYSSPVKENVSPSYKKYSRYDLTLNGKSANPYVGGNYVGGDDDKHGSIININNDHTGTDISPRKRQNPFTSSVSMSPRKDMDRRYNSRSTTTSSTDKHSTNYREIPRSISLKPPSRTTAATGAEKDKDNVITPSSGSRVPRTRSLRLPSETRESQTRSQIIKPTLESNTSSSKPHLSDLNLSLEHATPSIVPKKPTIASEFEKYKAQTSVELAAKDAQISGKDAEIKILRQRLKASEENVHSHERQTQEAVQSAVETICDDLHKKYQAKFETRIEELKSFLERKHKRELSNLRITLTQEFDKDKLALQDEIKTLKEELQQKEVKLEEIISLWDDFQRLSAKTAK